MEVSMYLMVGSGLVALALFVLFKLEAAQGQRLFLRHWRSRIDTRIVEVLPENWRRYRNAISLRLLVHYLLHRFLGLALLLNKKVESGLAKLRHRNRRIAKDVTTSPIDNHLARIARHKEETTLSEAEQEVLKQRSLHQS